MLSHRFIALQIHFLFWTAIVILIHILGYVSFLPILAPIILIDIFYAFSLGLMLRLPRNREDSEAPEGWEWEHYDVRNYPVRWLNKSMDSKKPLAILIHGWNSRASNMIGRSKLFEKYGYNCVLFEMRAHGGNQRVKHWAAMHIVHDLEQILLLFDSRGWLDKGFIIHGHSLGGFVAQRAMRPSLNTSKDALGMILESPVTSYEYINNQTCAYLNIPKLLHRPMMNRLIRYYNTLNPAEFSVTEIDMLSTPKWGFPQCPTILVQAKNDATLGLEHAELLIEAHNLKSTDFTYHIVGELKHAYEANNEVRDRLISDWMKEKSLFFD